MAESSKPDRTQSPDPGEVCVSLILIIKPFRVEPVLRALARFVSSPLQ